MVTKPHKWKAPVPRQLWKRFSKRLRRSVKRRMKGESRRQWIERNLHDSEVGIMLDIVQCILRFGDVAPKSNLGKAFDVALIFFAGALIPIQISGYSYILSRETAFDKKYEPEKIVGLRTIEDTTTVYPIDEELSDGNFLSVFFIGRDIDIASKIEKLTPAVFARHPDIAPASMGVAGNRNMRTVATLLSAAIDHKMAFPRRMSVGFGRRTSTTPVKPVMKQNLKPLASSKSFHMSMFSARTLDKITPVDKEEDEESEPMVAEDRSLKPTADDHRVDARRYSLMHVDSTRFSADQNYSLGNPALGETVAKHPPKPVIPVIALTPAELVKKATTPRARTYKDPIIKPLSARNHSQMSARERSARDRSVRDRSVRESSCQHRSSGPIPDEQEQAVTLTPDDTTDSAIQEDQTPVVEQHTLSNDSGPLVSDIMSAPQQHQSTTQEEDYYQPLNWEPLPGLTRPSVSTGGSLRSTVAGSGSLRASVAGSGNLRSRIRHLSLCFRREPPPPELNGHFVICGTPSNYADFLANLSDLGETAPALVFVTPRSLTEKDLLAHQQHQKMYFVRGSPLSMHVFHTARMFYARSILIMSYCGVEVDGGQDTEVATDENMADVDAITTHRFISEALQNELSHMQLNGVKEKREIPFIVAEMIRPSNVKFLIDRSGSLFDEKAAESEPRRRDLLKDVKFLDNSFFSPLYTSGHIYFSNIMDSLMGSCSNQQLMIEMVTQLIISGNMSMNMPNRVQRSRHRLSQIPAPERYYFRPYALLVEGLLHNEDIMTLGIFRSASTRTAPQYVLTNPPGDELVTPQDLLFVIK
ncbi:hypothetical protein PHYBOEH_002955 [Phytophthora boehmeriae]|uniref:RCK N-terminal domain-containing protein n=1 Tax=Phytophthora boehmeriae TaxID=109152 RepID=A0A8T1WWK5_9STRA|nr:hypothetical protein PHYBOEH_002955 [Phytophthora boehmeriae]